MNFNQKLVLLMDALQLNNTKLAKVLAVDASLISRWRTGSRAPSEKGNYLKQIAFYCESLAQKESQKLALYELMELEHYYNQESLYSLSELIYNWLNEDKAADNKFVSNFFNKMKDLDSPKAGFVEDRIEIKSTFKKRKKIESLKGIEGKREGVVDFLSAVAASDSPKTLYLYSDENMEWLTGDKTFYLKWRQLFREVIDRGHKIKIIHTIKRDLKELLTAIDYWLPLYMTGKIEPYYYPHYNKHIFQRTLFIAPELAALTSSTFSDKIEQGEQFFYRDKNKIKQLKEEFEQFLQICRPLMRIFKDRETQNFNQLQLEFDQQQGDLTNVSDMLLFVNMPRPLLEKMLQRAGTAAEIKAAILDLHAARFEAFINNLKHNQVKEIVYLPEIKELGQKELKLNDFFGEIDLVYRPEDYLEHLKFIKSLLLKYPNYSFYRLKVNLSQNIYISIKEGVGVVVAKNTDSPIIFAINQKDMLEAFSSYFDL